MNATVADSFNVSSGLLPIAVQQAITFEDEVTAAAPEQNLALAVLRQAAYDLRRFREPTNKLERELYRDAYDWIWASDFTWPYSFANICCLLEVPPEALREELLADASLRGVAYWCKVGRRFARCLKTSLVGSFERAPSVQQT